MYPVPSTRHTTASRRGGQGGLSKRGPPWLPSAKGTSVVRAWTFCRYILRPFFPVLPLVSRLTVPEHHPPILWKRMATTNEMADGGRTPERMHFVIVRCGLK